MPTSDKTTTSSGVQQVQLPQWVDDASQANYGMAQKVSNLPYQAYSGPLASGINDYQRRGASLADTGTGMSDTMIGQANGMAAKSGNYSPIMASANYAPQQVGPGQQVGAQQIGAQQIGMPAGVKDVSAAQFTPDQLAKYQNPYEDQVVQTSQQALNDSLAASQRGNGDSAIAAGAFGSSRHGVMEGVTAAEGAKAAALTTAGIRSQGFTTALGAAQSDLGRQDAASMANQSSGLTTQAQRLQAATSNQGASLAADTSNQDAALRAGISNQSMGMQAMLANQSAGLQGADLNQRGVLANQSAGLTANGQKQAAAGILSGNAAQTATNYNNDASAAAQLGTAQMMADQNRMDKNYSEFTRKNAYPTDQLNTRLAALGMSPYGKTTTSDGTSTTSGGDNPFMMGLGALGIGGSLFGVSDPKLKKNVKTVGKGPNNLNVKSFEYKKSFLDSPAGKNVPRGKVIGVMADDVKKKIPSAVKRVPIGNGKTAMAVNYTKAMTPKGGVFSFSRKAA